MNTKVIQVEIITIGDEILIGQIVDTNSAWMAGVLNHAGFELAQITSVHDRKDHILESLELALNRADIVLFTGGIGPTNDDITKQTLCEYFETQLVFNESVLKNIETLFSTRPYFIINDLTRAQAMVPENCTVIQNIVGTAPITWFEKNGKIIVSMPGVPYEMKHAMTTEIISRLHDYFRTPSILHKTVQVYGFGESALAIKIADWENQLPEHIHLAYLPNSGIVKLRLSGISDNLLELEFVMNQQIDLLSAILGDAIIAFEDKPLEELIGYLLSVKGYSISTAESCTGGNIAHLLTSVAGASNYFKGSVVAYANDVKTNLLAVSFDDIQKFGAVSQTVVEQMANGVRKLLKTDIAVATSGIAGPTGGTSEKPVGLVWISVCSTQRSITREFRFGALRDQNINRATQAALVMLKELL